MDPTSFFASSGAAAAFKYPAPLTTLVQQQHQTLGFYQVSSGVSPFSKVTNLNIDNTTTFDLSDDFKLKNISAYRKVKFHSSVDIDGLPVPLLLVEYVYRQHQVSEELQLQGKIGLIAIVEIGRAHV